MLLERAPPSRPCHGTRPEFLTKMWGAIAGLPHPYLRPSSPAGRARIESLLPSLLIVHCPDRCVEPWQLCALSRSRSPAPERELIPDRDHRIPSSPTTQRRSRTVVMSGSRIPAQTIEWYSQRTSASHAGDQLTGSMPAITPNSCYPVDGRRRPGHGFCDWERLVERCCRSGDGQHDHVGDQEG